MKTVGVSRRTNGSTFPNQEEAKSLDQNARRRLVKPSSEHVGRAASKEQEEDRRGGSRPHGTDMRQHQQMQQQRHHTESNDSSGNDAGNEADYDMYDDSSPDRRNRDADRDDATNDDMFYNGDDMDYDVDDDMVDDMIDDQAQYGLAQHDAAVTQNSLENLSSSPDITSKQVKSLRHAATIAASSQEQPLFDTEAKSRAKAVGAPAVGAQKTAPPAKKTKLVAVQEPPDATANENYSPHNVVAKMLMKKDRKIPGSVYKPHSEEIILLQSVALGQPQPSARVFFPYPKYCFRGASGKGGDSGGLLVQSKEARTSGAMQQGASFLSIIDWSGKAQLKPFQKVQVAK